MRKKMRRSFQAKKYARSLNGRVGGSKLIGRKIDLKRGTIGKTLKSEKSYSELFST